MEHQKVSFADKENLHNMKRRFIKGIALLLTAVFVISIATVHSYANEINKAKEEKTNLEKKKEETELRLKELEKEKNDILNYIEKLDKELSKLTEEIDLLNNQIGATNEELETAKAELIVAKEMEENQYDIMKKRIKYMYENGDTAYLNLILQADNLADILNQVEYTAKITEYDNSLLDNYTKLKEEVIEKEKVIEEKLQTLNALKEEVEYEQETVAHLAEEKNKELVKYDESIKETKELSEEVSSKIEAQEDLIEQLLEAERKRIEAERKAREAEQKRLEEERRRKEAEQNKQNTNNQASSGSSTNKEVEGDYIWPVPASGRITSYFGYRSQPTAGASTYHKGIDIGAPTGTKIIAAKSGSVVTASYQVAAGNYIMLSHGDGSFSVYMHCSKLLVSVGDYVNQGEEIALIGSTGVSTGPHLHFGISVDGSYVDPLDYVSY